jgi:hypothetical protein
VAPKASPIVEQPSPAVQEPQSEPAVSLPSEETTATNDSSYAEGDKIDTEGLG